MKRKLFVLLLSVIFAVCLSIAFVACGEEEEYTEPDDTEYEEPSEEGSLEEEESFVSGDTFHDGVLYYQVNSDGISCTVTGVRTLSDTSLVIPDTSRGGVTGCCNRRQGLFKMRRADDGFYPGDRNNYREKRIPRLYGFEMHRYSG